MVGHALTRLTDWLRGRYPMWAPRRGGHIALIALCGRQGPLDWEAEAPR